MTIAVGGSYTVTVSVPEAAKTLSLTDSGAVLQVSAGLSVGGGFVAAAGTIAVSSGQTLSLAGAVTFGVNGTTGPTVNGPGTVLTSGATSIAAQTGYNYPDLFIGNGATWVNTGTVTDAGLIYFGITSNDTVTLTNRAGGVFNLTSSNATFNTQYGNVGATFNNAGLLEKTAGTGNSNFIAALNNTGTVSVTAGTLTLANGGTLGGAVGSSGAGLLAFSGGSFTDTGTLSGALLVNGGSLAIAAASSLSGGLTVSSGLLTVAASSSEADAFTAAAGTIAVSSGQTLSLAGAVTFGVNGTTGPTVNGPGTVLTSGATSIAAQTGGNYPDLFIGNGATWVNTGTVTDAGLIYLGTTSNDTVTLTNRAGGVFNLTSSNATFNTQYGNVGATFNNAGLLEKTAGTGNSNFIAALNNTGTVSVTAGTLTLANGGTLGGAVGSSGAGLLAFSGGSFTDTGTLSGALLVNGGSLAIAAASSLSGGLTVSSGLLTVAASSSEADAFTAAAGTIAVSSGQTLSLAGAVTFGVNGTTGPTVNGPGTVLTSGATSIAAQTGGNYPDLFIGNGATWVNTGTVTDAGLIYLGTTSNDTVTLTNRAGGVFNLTSSNATFNTQYGNVGATFNNAGLLEKTAGTGNSNFIAALNNTGTVKVDQASTLTLANNFTDAGSIVLAGGVLAAPTLTLAAGATLSGFGTLSAAVVDSGLIDAFGGDLVLTKAPTGTGIERIEAASTLELAAASAGAATFNGLGARLRIDVANSYTGTLTNVAAGDGLILQGVTATGATTSGTALTVNLAGGGTEKFTLSAPLTAIREGVTLDGSGNSSVVFYRYAAPAAVTPIAFANHHVGDVATVAVPVTNTAAADGYSEVLDATVGSANAAITVAGSVSLLGAGQTSANGLSVTLLTTTGGAKTGTATVGFSTDGAGVDGDPALALAGQTLNVSGNVYNYATASLGAVSFGNHHVGDVVSQAVTLSNTAPAGAFSENLNAAFTGAAGSLIDSGTVFELAAGAASTGLGVTLASGTAGAITGTATLALVSDGSTIDGLGTTALASQVITGSAKIYNYATASLAPSTVSFGNHHVGDAVTQAVTLANNAAAGAYSENLNAAFTAAMGGLTDSGTVSGLAAGSSSAALLVTLATGVAGAISGTATLGLQSDGSTIDGLGTTALAGQTITGSGGIYNYATASVGTTLDLGIAHVGDTVAGAVSVGNAAASGGYSENLDAAFGAAAGLTASGTISALAAGGTSTALSVALTGTVSGKASGTAGLKFASDGAGVDGLGATQLAAATVTASAIFDNYATAALAGTGAGAFGGAGTVFTLDFGTVTQGMNPVSELIQLLNTASGTADRLDGSFTVTGDPSFGNGGFGPVTGESAGASVDAGTISLSRTAVGQFSETVTLTAFGVNAAGYHGALAAEVLTDRGRGGMLRHRDADPHTRRRPSGRNDGDRRHGRAGGRRPRAGALDRPAVLCRPVPGGPTCGRSGAHPRRRARSPVAGTGPAGVAQTRDAGGRGAGCGRTAGGRRDGRARARTEPGGLPPPRARPPRDHPGRRRGHRELCRRRQPQHVPQRARIPGALRRTLRGGHVLRATGGKRVGTGSHTAPACLPSGSSGPGSRGLTGARAHRLSRTRPARRRCRGGAARPQRRPARRRPRRPAPIGGTAACPGTTAYRSDRAASASPPGSASSPMRGRRSRRPGGPPRCRW